MRDLIFRNLEAGQFILRHVDAPLGEVHRNVLQEVDELQARADRVRIGEVARRGRAKQFEQKPSHRIRRAPAVVEHFVEAGIALLLHVLGEGGEEIAERLQREMIIADDRPKCREPWNSRSQALLDPAQFGAKGREPRYSNVIGGVALVGEVVGLPREPVDLGHRVAKLTRQEERGDGEVFVVVYRHLLLRNTHSDQWIASQP